MRQLEIVAALSLAALVLYVPANIFPIMKMYMYGAYSESTVWDGIVLLMQYDQWLVAVIVFLASMVIPLSKNLSKLAVLNFRYLFDVGTQLDTKGQSLVFSATFKMH